MLQRSVASGELEARAPIKCENVKNFQVIEGEISEKKIRKKKVGQIFNIFSLATHFDIV